MRENLQSYNKYIREYERLRLTTKYGKISYYFSREGIRDVLRFKLEK